MSDHNAQPDETVGQQQGPAHPSSFILPPFLEAVRFLTIIRLSWLPPSDEASMLRALPWFPAVGLLIGALLLPVAWLAGQFWGAFVVGALLVVSWAVLTGGLHLDGLSDTFDGVMSWRPRARKLEIMKDSRIGAMGALAIAAVLLLKLALLSELGPVWWQALLLAPLLGRWADLFSIAQFPSAAEGGLGHAFHTQLRRQDFVLATALTATVTMVIGGLPGLVAMLLVTSVAYLLARWWTNELGGLTGDTYGALCEITEVVVLATLVAAAA